VSNNFSLARLVKPVWDGCLASSEPAFHAWHIEKKFPLFAWSSQARGFFVPGRAAPDKRDEKSLVECWYSEDNFARQRRCFELAKKKGVEPVSVALAYVLHQPFPIWALIGPDNLAEIRTSFDGLGVTLTPDEVKWLNSGD
jgi:aryl-alcohol dehydrogenase-like predicted oxidoreductase